ncbi:CBS domain-containing protein [Winogradskyella psychrotolerans]|uniref:CBS domain-containing protein n=1 Tax=Winogradskyella damuponensis TaxID=943939 RepID=A0ABP8CWC8_9FLAO|nr:CBS domain-containing protein [Winogradskyella psychrotolerans]MBU2922177.1 CBS domain-containing protein [Winogradskyella psychrotolerans]
MKNNALISTIMSTDIIALNREDDLERAELLFKRHKIRHIPVVNEGVIIGMLSYTDLLRISFADAVDETETEIETLVYNMFTIDQVMAKNVVTIPSDATIKEVAKILAEKEFHALPVVDKGRLVGIVTTTDLINYLLKQL